MCLRGHDELAREGEPGVIWGRFQSRPCQQVLVSAGSAKPARLQGQVTGTG